ncbi:hypothetical protein ACI68E_001398 [Malassezia pachydermatis]
MATEIHALVQADARREQLQHHVETACAQLGSVHADEREKASSTLLSLGSSPTVVDDTCFLLGTLPSTLTQSFVTRRYSALSRPWCTTSGTSAD